MVDIYAENNIKENFVKQINVMHDTYKGRHKVCAHIPIKILKNITEQAERYNVKFRVFSFFLIARAVLENRELEVNDVKRMTKERKTTKSPSLKTVVFLFNDELLENFEAYRQQHNFGTKSGLCVEILKEYHLPVTEEIAAQTKYLAASAVQKQTHTNADNASIREYESKRESERINAELRKNRLAFGEMIEKVIFNEILTQKEAEWIDKNVPFQTHEQLVAKLTVLKDKLFPLK